jgi:hypothetical protein
MELQAAVLAYRRLVPLEMAETLTDAPRSTEQEENAA